MNRFTAPAEGCQLPGARLSQHHTTAGPIGGGRADPDEAVVIRFIRDRTSDVDFGFDLRTRRDRTRPVPHANPAAILRAAINGGEPTPDGRRTFARRLTVQSFWDHQRGKITLCFSGNGRREAPESLFLIDVDCKDRPNPVEARRFLADLAADVPAFAGLFVEPSTGGGGAHGYAVLVKPGLPARAANRLLATLQAYVRRRLADGQADGRHGDITDVEIRGTCPVVEWEPGDDKPRARDVRCGLLAKVPVTALDRPAAFLAMPRLDEATIRRLDSGPTPAVTPKAAPPRRRGSTSPHPLPRAILERLDSSYAATAARIAPTPIPTSGRHVATVQDIAIFLAIVGHLSSKQGRDRAMPSRRIEAIWAAAHEAGDVRRPHCVKRVAAIRNHLSDRGLIDWQDPHFWSHDRDDWEGGTPRKGVCCRYSLAPHLMVDLGLTDRPRLVLVAEKNTAGTGPPPPTPDPCHRPVEADQPARIGPVDGLPPPQGPAIRPIRVGWASQHWRRAA